MEQTFSSDEIYPMPDDLTLSGQHPLARLLEDDSIRIMEQLIPYCDSPANRYLALEIKFREIRKILHGFDRQELKACGLENENRDVESLLKSLKNTVSPQMSLQIDSVLHIFKLVRVFQRFQEITRDHPEILNMMAPDRSGTDEKAGGDAFTDPSVYMLLHSMLGNGDGNSGDKMKNVLELTMKGSNENMDMTKLLTSLLS